MLLSPLDLTLVILFFMVSQLILFIVFDSFRILWHMLSSPKQKEVITSHLSLKGYTGYQLNSELHTKLAYLPTKLSPQVNDHSSTLLLLSETLYLILSVARILWILSDQILKPISFPHKLITYHRPAFWI